MKKGTYIRTKENREFMRRLNLGRKQSEETKKKMSIKRKLRVGKLAPCYGKVFSKKKFTNKN